MSEVTKLQFAWGDVATLSCGFIFADGETVSSARYPRREVTGNADEFTIRFAGEGELPDLALKGRRAGEGAFEFALTIRARPAMARPVRWLQVLDVDVTDWLGPREHAWIFRHGTQSPGDPDICVSLAPGRAREADGCPPFCREEEGVEVYSGESIIAGRNLSTGRGGLFGFVTLDRQAARVEIRAQGERLRLVALSDVWQWTGAAGGDVTSETLRFETGADDNALLDAWVARIVELAPVKPRVSGATFTGWSDWQYYRRDVTENDVLENLAAIRSEGLPLEWLIVDDGFQANMSDWLEANDRWPTGIAEVGRRIAAAGMKPGVWLAPLTAFEGSRFARDHGDWLLRGASGEPNWKESHMGRVCAVDFTVPAALEWLRALMRTFVSDFGFRWIKLDGPILGYYEGGRFARPGLTQVAVVRLALEAVRDASAGAIVEGEGYYGPSIGLVDVQRVTQDIQTSWPRLRLMAQSNCLSGHFHGRLWVNNPETFILRDSVTPHYKDEVLLAKDALELEITVIALSGGVALLADPIRALSRERKSLIAACFPVYPQAARPVRLFEGRACPSAYRLRVDKPFGRWEVLAACNWEDAERDVTMPLPAGKSHVFDFWRRQYLGVREKEICLSVAPHGVRLISARPVLGGAIELVGTAVHVTQGAAELDDFAESHGGRGLRFALRMPFGKKATLFVRADGAPRSIGPVRAFVWPAEGDVYSVTLEGEGRLEVELAVR